MSNKKLTYAESGVDIKKADQFVDGIKGMLAKSVLAKVAAFGCPFDLGALSKKYKHPVLVSSTDGVGTKLLIAQAAGIHNTVGIDLVAMNVNDVICLGAKPLFFLDYLACGKVKPEVLKQVVSGIHEGLRQSDCQLIGGETAEMPGMYQEDEYDLAGFCCGIVDKNEIVNGRQMRPGDVVIGLESSGLHSNGFSLARKALGERGVKKHTRQLLEPTRIYVKPLLSLLSSMGRQLPSVKGIAHITGGAFYSKAVKIVPPGLSMVINRKSWGVPKIFRQIQAAGGISEKEMYTVFNMGLGMMVVADKKICAGVLASLNKSVRARVVGMIDKGSDRMVLV